MNRYWKDNCLVKTGNFIYGMVGVLLGLYIIAVMLNNTLDMVENPDEYNRQVIQNNTKTVLIDGKECVLYDDGGLFSSPSIDCEWGEN